MSAAQNSDPASLTLAVHVHTKGGERGDRECEKLVVPVQRYAASTTLAEVAATFDVPVDVEVRTFLTKFMGLHADFGGPRNCSANPI